MGVADDMLDDNEAKYFNSRGKYEPEGFEPEGSDSSAGQDLQDGTSEPDEQSDSKRFDGSVSEGSGTEDEESGVYGQADDDADKPTATEKQSKRDFEKAYGIAESKRQELKEQLENQGRQTEGLKQQLDLLMKNMQRQQEPVAQNNAPDKDEDPLAYYQHQIENINKTVAEQQKYLQQQAAAQQKQTSMQNFVGAYKQSAQQFMQDAPDFGDAYKFLEKSKINEYIASGYSQREAVDLLQEDEMAIAAKAFNEKANPAERIYRLAKARGYVAKEPPVSKLENVAKGMQKAKTLPRSGGQNLERGLDFSMIDKMSDKEFDKLFNQVKDESKRNGDYRKDFY